MIFEHYIDANFIVDFFLPDDIATQQEGTWKQNAGKLYEQVRSNPDAKIMLSHESMLEAVGVIGRRLLEEASKKKPINKTGLATRMAHIAFEITSWEQKGKKDNKIRMKSPMSIKKKVYEKALELCRKYSVTPLKSYTYGEDVIYEGIGGIDAFHLAYAAERDQTGKIMSFLVTRDRALSEAARREGLSVKTP